MLTEYFYFQDGRFSTNELCNIVEHDEAFDDVKRRITSTDVLLIDEISMVCVSFTNILLYRLNYF